MKRLNVFFTVFACLSTIGLISCNSSKDQKNETYKKDYKEFKAKIKKKIEDNEEMIADFNKKAEDMKESVKEDYRQKINKLQQKNLEMKQKLNNYKVESQKGWENFKAEFSNDFNELTKALHNLVERNDN